MLEKSLLLLDYDGVIVDSAQPVLDETAAFCAIHQISFNLNIEDFDRLNPATFTRLAKICGIPDSKHRDYAQFLFDRLQSKERRIPLFNGIKDLIHDLSRYHTLCVVTANRAEVVENRLTHEKIQNCIDIYYGSDRPGSKADHIHQALNHYAIPAANAWMIGDSVSDIDAARHGGVNSVAVSWGWQSRSLLSSHSPDLLFDTPQEMYTFFKPN